MIPTQLFTARVVPIDQMVVMYRSDVGRHITKEFTRRTFETQAARLAQFPIDVRAGHEGKKVGRVIRFVPPHLARGWAEVCFVVTDPTHEPAVGDEVSAGFTFSRTAPGETDIHLDGMTHNFAAMHELALVPQGERGAIPGAEVIDVSPYVGDDERALHRGWALLTRDERQTIEGLILSGVPRERINAAIESTPGLMDRVPRL